MVIKSAIRVSLIILFLTISAYIIQQTIYENFPGNYPKFASPVEAEFNFGNKQARIHVPSELDGLNVFVFAYDTQGHMQALVKPVLNGAVQVSRGDYSDINVKFGENGEVTGYGMLKRMDGYTREIDMFDALKEAKTNGRQIGIQRCLFPVCTRCIDACKSVISGGDLALEMRKGLDGAIRPIYSKGKCPRCGKCFVWCPVAVITGTSSLLGK